MIIFAFFFVFSFASASSGSGNSSNTGDQRGVFQLKCPCHTRFYLKSAPDGHQDGDECTRRTRYSELVAEAIAKAQSPSAANGTWSLVHPSLFPDIIPPYIHFSLVPSSAMDPDIENLTKELQWAGPNPLVEHIVANMGMKLVNAPRRRGGSGQSQALAPWLGLFTMKLKAGITPRMAVKHPWQKFNQLPGSIELCHKASMWTSVLRTLKRVGLDSGSDRDEFPALFETYRWPGEIFQFYSRLTRWSSAQDWWIFKGSSCSKSQCLVTFQNDLSKLFPRTRFHRHPAGVIQRFLRHRDTFQIEGRALQFRVYLLQTGVNPLRLFMYREWQVLLVNYQMDPIGMLAPYEEIVDWFHSWHGGAELLQSWRTQITDVVTKLMLGVDHNMGRAYRKAYGDNNYNGYQFWSADVIVDKHGKAWLMELNRYANTDVHYKNGALHRIRLLLDTLNLVGFHFPPTLSEKGQETLRKVSGTGGGENEKPIVFQEEVYSYRNRKENGARMLKLGGNKNKIFQDMSNADLKQLLIAEDELNRARATNYERIFPTENASKYFKFLHHPKSRLHAYLLQDAWERRYGADRTAGIEELRRLARIKIKNIPSAPGD